MRLLHGQRRISAHLHVTVAISCHIVFASFCATSFLLFCAFLLAEGAGGNGEKGAEQGKNYF
jgi:hypothetical protein